MASFSSTDSASSAVSTSSLQREINRRVLDAPSLEKLVDVVLDCAPEFNAVNVSTAFHRLAKLWAAAGPEAGSLVAAADGRVGAAIETLTKVASAAVGTFQGQGLGSVLWAYAMIGWDPGRIRPLLEAFAKEAVVRLSQASEGAHAAYKLNSQALSNLVHAYAVLGHYPGAELMAAVARGVQNQLRDFSPQGLSNIVWAYAKLGAPVTQEVRLLLEALAVEAVSQLVDARSRAAFVPANLANLLYGYAVLGVEPGPLLAGAVAKEAARQLRDFGPQELSNLVWAYAKLGPPLAPGVDELLNAAADELAAQTADPERQAKVKPSIGANLLWAFATLGRAPPKLLSALAVVGLRHAGAYKAAELANVVWAHGALRYYPGAAYMGAICDAAGKQLPAFSPAELSSLLWGLGAVRYHPGDGFAAALLGEVESRLARFSAQELAAVLGGAAALGLAPSSRLAGAGAALALEWSAGAEPSTTCALLWTLAVLGALGPAQLTTLAAALAPVPVASLPPEALQQLFQAVLAASPKSLEGARAAFSLPLLKAAEAAWRASSGERKLSKVHRDISIVLLGLNLSHRLDQALEEGALQVDVALLQQRVAIDVCPPTAYCLNEPHRPLGRVLLRWRLLEQRGWEVVPVPFHTWSALAPDQRPHYLRQLLERVPTLRLLLAEPLSAVQFPVLRDEAAAEEGGGGQDGPDSARPHGGGGGSGGAAVVPQDLLSAPDAEWERLLDRPIGAAPSAPGRWEGRGGDSPARSNGGSSSGTSTTLRPDSGAGMRADGGVRPISASGQLALPRDAPFPAAGPSGQPDGNPGEALFGAARLPDRPAAVPGAAGAQMPGLAELARVPQPLLLPPTPPPKAKPGSKDAKPGSGGDLRQLWQQVMRLGPGQVLEGGEQAVAVAELKRLVAGLPLEKSAVGAVAPHLHGLSPGEFAALLQELAKDNHAFRAWQLFDWVRNLPADNSLRLLCDSHTYSTMIALCGPWQQLRRALQLVADMRASGMECGPDAFVALLNAAVKCGELDLAADVYGQMLEEHIGLDRAVFHLMIDVFLKMERWSDAMAVLDEIRAHGLQPEVQTYNLLMVTCTKLSQPSNAVNAYHQMRADGVLPNIKTFTALIAAFAKMGTPERIFGLVDEIVAANPDATPAMHSALMSACEKAGEWDLAVELFDRMVAAHVVPDTGIFNSLIAACAHGGEFAKARAMFDAMAAHGRQPDAVSFANLIRAYKKGAQWCHALDTFERMQAAGCSPHAAVYSSVIDLLWQTGNGWAVARAVQLFNAALRSGCMPGAARTSKKGTLKVDLQALTVAVALLSMHQWLASLRDHVSLEATLQLLDANRKLAVVNGMGDHNRSQGNSSAVKEAVASSLAGCAAPFRLVQEHSRSGRLEAPTAQLKKWLFSKGWDAYHAMFSGDPPSLARWGVQEGVLLSTSEYLAREEACLAHATESWALLTKYEAVQAVPPHVPPEYLHRRKQLVLSMLRFAGMLGLSEQVGYGSIALMDGTIMRGATVPEELAALFLCSCLRMVAANEASYVPSAEAVGLMVSYAPLAVERMEAEIRGFVTADALFISPYHALKVYAERLDCNLADAKAQALSCGRAFALLPDVVAHPGVLQFSPTIVAAAVLAMGRRMAGCVPAWPSLLAGLTGYVEGGTPQFASCCAMVDRLVGKAYAPLPLPGPPGVEQHMGMYG